MNRSKTRGQIERSLCQQAQGLYRDLIGQYPISALSRVFDRRLIILLQDTSPPVGKLLAETGQSMLVQQMNTEIEAALKPRLKALIEEVLEIKATTVLLASDPETGLTCVAALLEEAPDLREKISKPASQQVPKSTDQRLSNAS